MSEQKEKIVIDGNAFYELDLDCQKRMESQKRPGNRKNENQSQKMSEDCRKRKQSVRIQ